MRFCLFCILVLKYMRIFKKLVCEVRFYGKKTRTRGKKLNHIPGK